MKKRKIFAFQMQPKQSKPQLKESEITCVSIPRLKDWIAVLQAIEVDDRIENKEDALYKLFLYQYNSLVGIVARLKKQNIIPRIDDQDQLYFVVIHDLICLHNEGELIPQIIALQEKIGINLDD